MTTPHPFLTNNFMGVDIYGMKPSMKGEQPAMPDDYQDLTDEEKRAHWDKVKDWEQDNPGYYFRNNWWHWRPIQALINAFNEMYGIGIPEEEIKYLGSNDGIGVSDSGHCEQLAIAFNKLINDMQRDGQSIVCLNTGSWYYKSLDESGRMVEVPVKDQDLIKRLNEKYAGAFFEEPELDGIAYFTSHGTNIDNLKRFTAFLENCNGFKIY